MEERPTRRDYKEISTCRAIILHLEDSRSHGKEAEAERGQALGARPLLESKQDSLSGKISTDLKDQGKPFNQCLFDPTAHIHLKGL